MERSPGAKIRALNIGQMREAQDKGLNIIIIEKPALGQREGTEYRADE